MAAYCVSPPHGSKFADSDANIGLSEDQLLTNNGYYSELLRQGFVCDVVRHMNDECVLEMRVVRHPITPKDFYYIRRLLGESVQAFYRLKYRQQNA